MNAQKNLLKKPQPELRKNSLFSWKKKRKNKRNFDRKNPDECFSSLCVTEESSKHIEETVFMEAQKLIYTSRKDITHLVRCNDESKKYFFQGTDQRNEQMYHFDAFPFSVQ